MNLGHPENDLNSDNEEIETVTEHPRKTASLHDHEDRRESSSEDSDTDVLSKCGKNAY